MKNNKKDNGSEDNFQDNSFTRAQKEAEDGKAPKNTNQQEDENAKMKAKDKLMRAKNADKEVTTESEKYRRDNA